MARDNDIDKGKWAAGDFASWMLENADGQAIARQLSDGTTTSATTRAAV